MNKKELAVSIAKKHKITSAKSQKLLQAYLDEIMRVLQEGERVSLSGFGTFSTKHRAQKVCVNPKTKERLIIDSVTAPVFCAGKDLKEKVAGKAGDRTIINR